MKFAVRNEVRNSMGEPIPGSVDLVAGLSDQDSAATCGFRITSTPDEAQVAGRLMFPEHAAFTFRGDLATLKSAIRTAPSWYALAKDSRFEWWRD